MSNLQNKEEVASALKLAMRRMASSVSVISAAGSDGQRAAMTATSVTSLSMDPPSMLVCVNRNTRLYQLLCEGVDFCINTLAVDQIDIAQSCGGRVSTEERFGDSWGDTGGVPMILGAQAVMLCKQVTRVALGTHDIVIGSVRQVVLDGADVDPLLYVNGNYARVGSTL